MCEEKTVAAAAQHARLLRLLIMLFSAAAAVGAEFGQPAVERHNHLYRDYMYSRLCLSFIIHIIYRLYAVHSVTGCILAQRETWYST